MARVSSSATMSSMTSSESTTTALPTDAQMLEPTPWAWAYWKVARAMEPLSNTAPSGIRAAEAVRRSAGKTASVTWNHEGQVEASVLKQLQDMEHQANPMALWQRISLETSLTKPEITYLIAGHVLALGYPRHTDVWGEISGLSFVARHPQEGTLRAQVSRDTAI